MPTQSARRWVAAKIIGGSLFFALLLAGAALLAGMAAFRATLAYPESGLFLARALVLLPMGACLVMAAWYFASLKIRIPMQTPRRILLAVAVLCGAACIVATLYFYGDVCAYYIRYYRAGIG